MTWTPPDDSFAEDYTEGGGGIVPMSRLFNAPAATVLELAPVQTQIPSGNA
jgi:hypothetical protein